jgi:thiamine-monophosphate kinase
MSKEKFFIDSFDSKYIGDDGAVVGELVYTTDSFFENVHFKREWLTIYEIAQKAMLVNISDAIVMNAKPQYALLNVAIPSNFSEANLQELSQSFRDVAKEYGIEIIGGDTISNSKLDISITLISKTTNPIYRTGLKDGNLIAYSGELGSVKKDLYALFHGEQISKDSKFIKPKLHPELFYEISPYISCAMDISDGLFFELARLSKVNNLGINISKDISEDIGCSGEEYEVLFGFETSKISTIEKIFQKHNISFNLIGEALQGIGLFNCSCKEHHF